MLVRDRSTFELRALGRLPRACLLVCVYVTVAFVFFGISRLRGTSARRRKGEGRRGRGVGLGLFLIVGFSGGSCLSLFFAREVFGVRSHEDKCRRVDRY